MMEVAQREDGVIEGNNGANAHAGAPAPAARDSTRRNKFRKISIMEVASGASYTFLGHIIGSSNLEKADRK